MARFERDCRRNALVCGGKMKTSSRLFYIFWGVFRVLYPVFHKIYIEPDREVGNEFLSGSPGITGNFRFYTFRCRGLQKKGNQTGSCPIPPGFKSLNKIYNVTINLWQVVQCKLSGKDKLVTRNKSPKLLEVYG